jgi:hypothetical protein
MKNSDGSLRRKTWVYTTTSRQVAGMLQALLHTRGKVGSLTFTPYGDEGKMAIRVNVSDRTTPRVEPNQQGRSLSYKEALVPYEGSVYCATVSTGALLVRRNGKVAVSGNSPFEHVARPMLHEEIHEGVITVDGAWLDDHPGPTEAFSGNFRGWVQYRKTIPREHDIKAPVGTDYLHQPQLGLEENQR